jgi:hypothetical protein
VRLDDLEWSKSSAVKVTVFDGTLKRSIRPGSTATGAVTAAAGAAGVPAGAGAERWVPVLMRRVELTEDSGAVPMTRTSGSSSWARAGAGSASAPSAAARTIRRAADRNVGAARPHSPRTARPIALDRR